MMMMMMMMMMMRADDEDLSRLCVCTDGWMDGWEEVVYQESVLLFASNFGIGRGVMFVL